MRKLLKEKNLTCLSDIEYPPVELWRWLMLLFWWVFIVFIVCMVFIVFMWFIVLWPGKYHHNSWHYNICFFLRIVSYCNQKYLQQTCTFLYKRQTRKEFKSKHLYINNVMSEPYNRLSLRNKVVVVKNNILSEWLPYLTWKQNPHYLKTKQKNCLNHFIGDIN